MRTFRGIVREYRWLGLALVLAAAASTAITSCGGGGGGSSDGGLCEQCGDTDGPCQPTALIDPNSKKPCPNPTPATGCELRTLICRRKLDSGQQRCYPGISAAPDETGVDISFKCNGSRPAGTGRPDPVTPTPTGPTPTSARTADPNAVCNDGTRTGLEVCDGFALDGVTCGNFCDEDGGELLCTTACQFNISLCTGGNCSLN